MAGTLTQNSDARVKTNIQQLSPDVFEKLTLIKGVTFYWKDKGPDPYQQVGVIAQDVQKAYPQLVTADASGTLSVNYSGLVAPLIEATKQLGAKSDADDAKIARLEDAVGILVREVEAERARVGIIDQLAGTTALHVVWTKQEKQDLVNRATRYYPSPVKEFADLVNEVSATGRTKLHKLRFPISPR